MGTDFAAVGRLLSSQPRAAMLDALLGGRSLTAGQLAVVGGVRPSTASEHLAALVAGGMVVVETRGRSRFFSLSGYKIAVALESLSRICPTVPPRSLRQVQGAEAERFARTCYDHLAGTLGVAVLDSFLRQRWLRRRGAAFTLTGDGERSLVSMGVDVAAAHAARRRFAFACLDWSEQRPHLGGALGAAVAAAFVRQGWVHRRPQGRGLLVTTLGRSALTDRLSLPV
jgi:DNA-binding transcriptional ArsR family regulator